MIYVKHLARSIASDVMFYCVSLRIVFGSSPGSFYLYVRSAPFLVFLSSWTGTRRHVGHAAPSHNLAAKPLVFGERYEQSWSGWTKALMGENPTMLGIIPKMLPPINFQPTLGAFCLLQNPELLQLQLGLHSGDGQGHWL